MEHAWTMDEMDVTTKDNKVTGVTCKYCGKSLDFEQPDYSDNPDDVTVHPAHDCPKLPPETEEETA